MQRDNLAPKGVWDASRFHFSQAVRVREAKDLLMISGQVGITEDFKVVEGIEAQARLALENMRRIIIEAGGTMNNIIKLTAYFRDVSQLEAFEKVLTEFFKEGYPAQTALEIKALALPELLIEIEAIAAL
ncbi:MAG: RidA family protein [Candidatus Binataceae bacterium]